MSDAPKRGRGRPRKTQNAEEARLRKLQTDRERYYRLKMQPTVQSEDDEPSIPSSQAIPLRTAPKHTSPPPSYINISPQFASPKKTAPQARSLKTASPPSSSINTFRQFASPKKTSPQVPSPPSASINTFRQFASPKKTLPQAPSLKSPSPPSASTNTFRQFASPKKAPPQAPSPNEASPPPSTQIAFRQFAALPKTTRQALSPKKTHPQVPPPKKETPPQASPQKEPPIESSPLPSNQLFDDWNNTMYDDDDDDLDNYGGHTDEGSGGGHIEKGHTDDDDSEGGHTKEEAYIEEEEEDIYGVSDGEREAQRLPRGNQDALDDSDYQDSLEDPKTDEELAMPSQFSRTPSLNPVELDDSVADRLVEQLYSFHGCSSDAHDAHDDEYAQSPDSYTSISDLFRLQKPGGSIPDVLKLPGFMEQQQLNDPALLQQLFEGWGPPKEPQAEPEPPKKLHLPHKPPLEHQHRQPKVTYDIDSLCLFPTSLAVARKGLFWQPTPHSILNITTNVHFTLPADFYNARQELKHGPRSLHQIVHTCLGIVSGFEDLMLYAFFPRIVHPNRTTTYLTDDQQSLWLDGLFLPALYAEHKGEDGLLHPFPTSHKVAQANAFSHSAERSSIHQDIHLPRQQLLRCFIQPEKLAGIWDRVLADIEDNAAFAEFKGVTLFATAKDLKQRYMSESFPTMCRKWKQNYKWAVDPEFQACNQGFIDLGKQVTAEGSYLRMSSIPDSYKPQTFVYKRCCLESFFQWYCKRPNRKRSNQKGKKKKEEVDEEEGEKEEEEEEGREKEEEEEKEENEDGEANNKPKRTFYINFLTRDVANMTVHFPIGSIERKEGHVFGQFYSEIHAPFSAAKVIPFENKGYESLAVDPSLADALGHAGGAVVFKAENCERGYLASKHRAHCCTQDAQLQSLGTREEDRISLELMDKIEPKLAERLQQQEEEPPNYNYYYTIPSKTLFGFLRSQINKFCLGFEHLYKQETAVQWEKSQLMIYFLRMLQFSYGSRQLPQEKELWKDRWEVKDKHGVVLKKKEGLGLQKTISEYGLGWFLPKIDWETWGLLPTHAHGMVLDNPQLKKVYNKRWKAVHLTVEGATLIDDACRWAQRFNIASNYGRKRLWLDYLFAVNLQVFNEFIGNAIKGDLKPEYQQRALDGQVALCWDELSNAWAVGQPRLVVHSATRYKDGPMQLVDYLFDSDDTSVRGVWKKSSYRLIYQRTLKAIEEIDSKPRAEEWGRQFKKLLIFTCWLLPYATKTVLFDRARRGNGLPTERKWFSSYQATLPENFIHLYNSQNSDQGEDFQALLRLTHVYSNWQTGRKTTRLRGRPLKSKMVLELQGLSPHAREQYFENLMA
jgi:hypothetical protein